jgi:hypothetical protein
MIRKKGQEEMVGFVLIMVVVAVIFLIFLGIFVRKGVNDERTESSEVSQFLDAALEYTSSCSLNGYSFLSLSRLMFKCGEGKICISGEDTCDMLKRDIEDLVESSWNFGSDSPEKNYSLKVHAVSSAGHQQDLVVLGTDCSGAKRGADVPLDASAGMDITVTLELCLN